MRKISVAQLIERMEYSFIIRVAGIMFGFGMLIVSLTLLVFATFFQSQTKILSGVNYYPHPIVVQFNGNIAKLNAFETYNFTTTEFGTLKLEIFDASGKLLSIRKHETTRSAGIMIDILSQDDLAKLCYAQANVTNMYYLNTPDVALINEVKILTIKGSSALTYEVPAITNTTLHMGNYAGTQLPQTVGRHQRVWGVYPVDCNAVNDNQQVATQILHWSTVNPATQRDIYAEKVREINNSPEYNH